MGKAAIIPRQHPAVHRSAQVTRGHPNLSCCHLSPRSSLESVSNITGDVDEEGEAGLLPPPQALRPMGAHP
jgi:hypothetical protein